ncbi:MAG: isochorismatase family protein [Chloracidobacterium sp.]|nr:isochorismatase family protein [Chloracidobacterium sp.]
MSKIKRSRHQAGVICGLETHICVSQTAHDLLDRGFDVHILCDCVSSRFEYNRLAGLAKMTRSGAIESSVEMALFELMRDAKHEQFKEIQLLNGPFRFTNPQQIEAVKTTDGPLLILAGAGSGKTRVITVRIAYLIAEKQVAPHNILAVTFTNKAAGEMRSRVEELMKGQRMQSAPLISTFHSLCVRILRQDIDKLDEGYKKSFTIYDTDDSQKVVKACIKDLGLDEKQLAPRYVRNAISSAKNRGEDVEMFAAQGRTGRPKKAAIAKVFKMYDERLHTANALDFDDLLIKTVQLLRRSPETRDKYNERYKYILVDEYQDTNALQFAFISFLTEKQQNICVVGDDAQSIYGFRQADIRNILGFEEHFKDAKVILLEQNYRSTQTILDVAHAIIENNIHQKKKKLWTANPAANASFTIRLLTPTARRGLSRQRSRSINAAVSATALPSYIAPTPSRVCLKKPCAGCGSNITSSADFRFTSVPRSKM